MKISIEHSELIELKNKSAALLALENGGVDNWEYYEESMEDYEEITNLDGYGVATELPYSKGQELYYNNNSCEFVSYLSEKVAVIIIEAFPDFEEIESSRHCQGCMIGDSDNKLSCNCDEISMLIEDLESSTNPTHIPLIVNVSMLYERPIVITTHEAELELIKQKSKDVIERTKELSLKNIELEMKQKELEEKIKVLQELDLINSEIKN